MIEERTLHDAVWENVPAGARPERFELRRDFLLSNVRAGASDGVTWNALS